MATKAYLEVGDKRVFACVVDWPGWARSGKTEEEALEAVAAYRPRYEIVAKASGLALPANAAKDFDVVERVPGNATTDFGAPGVVPDLDAKALTAKTAERQATLVKAAWTVFDEVIAGTPASLRKGPRGGGRDRDKLVDHVLGAEAVYARKIGIRHREPARGDKAAIAALRDDILAALIKARKGEPPVEKGWPPRFAARRIAWHVLDHAWEAEDRS